MPTTAVCRARAESAYVVPMTTNPAAWHIDPSKRHELRYWDGTAWTDHVSDNAVTSVDAMPTDAGLADKVDAALTWKTASPEAIQQQVSGIGYKGAGIAMEPSVAGGTLFTERVLVVNQKAKLIEVTNQYTVYDQQGQPLGFVNEVGQSKARIVLRVLTKFDQYLTHRLAITDRTGAVLLQLTRPAKVFKSTVVVTDGANVELGRIVQENMIGKIHFAMQVGDQTLGHIRAENWRAWNFRIEDAEGTEVARITKTFEGFLKAAFTTADNYVLQLHVDLPQPFLSLVVASALSIDTALKQDDR